jgi:hypothetical protein
MEKKHEVTASLKLGRCGLPVRALSRERDGVLCTHDSAPDVLLAYEVG